MNRGYRLNNAHAYANYYADISNIADFNFFGNMKGRIAGLAGRVKGGIMGAGSAIASGGRRALGAIDDQAVRLGRQFYYRNLTGDQFGDIMTRTGKSYADAMRMINNRRRAIGYGVGAAGALGLGGAGYAGYRYLKNRQQPEEEMAG